ncbi:MAG TPA: glycosyltransferase family 4 protein [Thermoanaerobaculia bacterium]|nr:glycosyltransferase family 4 protein [Thermoanaerobaculia bacterium]
MRRLAIVASHVIQYQDPFFRRLAADGAVDVTVLYCSRAGADVYRDADMQTSLRWDIELLQGYDHRFLPNFGRGDGYARLINPGVVPAILRGSFDAVLLFLGWGTVTSLLAITACRMSGTPFLLYGDSSFPPAKRTWRERVRAAFLRGVFALAGGFMVSGVLNAAYYRNYGADASRFFLLPWAIDNERFEQGSRFAAGERDAMRAQFGIAPAQIAYVFSAKLVPRKDPMTLLRAVACMRGRERAAVVFLGHGELREPLEAYARAEGLQVRFAGFVNQADLPKHYAMCDVFVLPSVYEPRGAVINEAMACGLPVVVTDRCGSIGDIVLEGENAFIYPAGDAAALAHALDALADDGVRARMARRSREIIATWDYARGVEGVKQALAALERGA